MKELYEKHVNKIKCIFSDDVTKSLGVRSFQPKATKELLKSLVNVLPAYMLHSLNDNLQHDINLDMNTYLSYESLVGYLILLRNSRLRYSPIAIDRNTGNIIVFYNKNEDDKDSTKITIQCNNSHEYVYSILDRQEGLVIFSGKLKVQGGAHHKIENLMNMFE